MNKLIQLSASLTRACAALTVLALVGCGGGGSSSTSSAIGGIGGTGFKGPVSGAAVAAYSINNGSMGSQISSGTTDAQGNFNLSMGSYAGAVMLQLSGGTYTDEATGTAMAMASGDVMTAVLPSMAAGAMISGIQLTPLTSMAQAAAQHMTGGMTDANIATANTAVGGYFSVTDILHTTPMNPLVSGSGTGATQDMMNYGMTLAAMSQYAKAQGMNSSSAIVTAMMGDAADGTMDGKMSGASVMMGGMGGMGGMGSGMGVAMPFDAGSAGLSAAMNAFIANLSQNKSGVTASTMLALMNKLSGSTGHIMAAGGPTAASVSVSGSTFNGPVSMATVSAFAINNGVRGAQIASATTDGQGSFSMVFGSYSGPVMLQVNNGVYTDEATGLAATMGSADVMTAVLPSVAAGTAVSGIQMTPVTSLAQSMAVNMPGGMTDANITAANTAVGNYFMVGDILHTQPMNPLVPGSGTTATQSAMNYGMTLAAMSQYAKSVGMTAPSGIVTAMMKDAADGIMDGMGAGGQITMGGGMMSGGMMQPSAGTTGLATSMADFMNSSLNRSGLTVADLAALMQQMRTSNGRMH